MPRPRKTQADLYCTICQTAFTRTEHYQRHLRTHTKERPFACTWCGQSFGRVDSLTRHYTTVHKNPGTEGLRGSITDRRRVIQACTPCSQSKVRCDGNEPCQRCCNQNSYCYYGPSKSASTGVVDDGVSSKRFRDSIIPTGSAMENSEMISSTEVHTLLSKTGVRHDGLADRSDVGQTPIASHSGTLGEVAPALFNLQGETEATDGMNVTTDPLFSARDWIDFDSWFNFGAGDNYFLDLSYREPDFSMFDGVRPAPAKDSAPQVLSDGRPQNASLTPSAIEKLYDRSQLPEIDKDSVEPRQYHPSSAEVDTQLIFPDMTGATDEEVEEENLAHVERVLADIPEKVLQLASEIQVNSNYPRFIELRIPPAPVLNSWVQLYFEHFHPVFPVLHKPTFSPSGTNPFLVFTVAAIGAHFSSLKGSQSCVRAMHELIRRYTAYTCERWTRISRELWMTQTILLNQLGLLYSGDRRALELAEIFQAVPVTLGRRKRLFSDILPYDRISSLQLSLEEKWQISILDEQRRRTGFAIWLIDAMYDYNFDLSTAMRADELQNYFPQPEDRWNASSAQSWTVFGGGNVLVKHVTLGQVIINRSWRSVWSKTGTLGKQTILQYLANAVKNRDSSPKFSLDELQAAAEALECLLKETEDVKSICEVKAAIIHRVMIHAALMLYHTPTSSIASLAFKVIYGQIDDDLWAQVADSWTKSPSQGRLGVLHAAQVLETIRSNHCCSHFTTPVSLLRAVLALWLYSVVFNRLKQGIPQQRPISSVVLNLKSLGTAETTQWIESGSSCVKLPGIGNLLNATGRCKMLDESIVLMKSLKAWGISSMYAELLVRLRDVEANLGW